MQRCLSETRLVNERGNFPEGLKRTTPENAPPQRGIIHFVVIEGLRGKQPIGLVGDNLEKARTVM